MKVELTDQDVAALSYTAHVLVEIRRLAREGLASGTVSKFEQIERLADAVHNTPRLIADGQRESMGWLIDQEAKAAHALLYPPTTAFASALLTTATETRGYE